MSSVSRASPETQARKDPPPTSDSKRPSAATNLVEEIRNHPGKSGLKPAKKKPAQANVHLKDDLVSALEQRRQAHSNSSSNNSSLSDNIPFTG